MLDDYPYPFSTGHACLIASMPALVSAVIFPLIATMGTPLPTPIAYIIWQVVFGAIFAVPFSIGVCETIMRIRRNRIDPGWGQRRRFHKDGPPDFGDFIA